MLEFAISWPLALLLVLSAVQVSIWSAEAAAVHQAALAGARAGLAAGSGQVAAESVTLRTLSPALGGVSSGAWCPGSAEPAPGVWVCASAAAGEVRVRVGGSVPALVPLWPGASGLPVAADVRLRQEAFTP
jgi:hypothetical protein